MWAHAAKRGLFEIEVSRLTVVADAQRHPQKTPVPELRPGELGMPRNQIVDRDDPLPVGLSRCGRLCQFKSADAPGTTQCLRNRQTVRLDAGWHVGREPAPIQPVIDDGNRLSGNDSTRSDVQHGDTIAVLEPAWNGADRDHHDMASTQEIAGCRRLHGAGVPQGRRTDVTGLVVMRQPFEPVPALIGGQGEHAQMIWAVPQRQLTQHGPDQVRAIIAAHGNAPKPAQHHGDRHVLDGGCAPQQSIECPERHRVL